MVATGRGIDRNSHCTSGGGGRGGAGGHNAMFVGTEAVMGQFVREFFGSEEAYPHGFIC